MHISINEILYIVVLEPCFNAEQRFKCKKVLSRSSSWFNLNKYIFHSRNILDVLTSSYSLKILSFGVWKSRNRKNQWFVAGMSIIHAVERHMQQQSRMCVIHAPLFALVLVDPAWGMPNRILAWLKSRSTCWFFHSAFFTQFNLTLTRLLTIWTAASPISSSFDCQI